MDVQKERASHSQLDASEPKVSLFFMCRLVMLMSGNINHTFNYQKCHAKH